MKYAVQETCEKCTGGIHEETNLHCHYCDGTGVVFQEIEIKSSEKQVKKLIQDGLPYDFLETCRWCDGTGDDGGGYNYCPDCSGSGMKYGQEADDYLSKELDKLFQISETILETLSEDYGFGRIEFIPDHLTKGFMEYFGHLFEQEEYLEAPEKVKEEMLQELPPEGFRPDSVTGYLFPNGVLAISLSHHTKLLLEEKTYEKNEIDQMLRNIDGTFQVEEYQKLRNEITVVNEILSTRKSNKDIVEFEIPYESLARIPKEIKYKKNHRIL